jgi:hypothetical protein
MGGITTAVIGSFVKPKPPRYFILEMIDLKNAATQNFVQISEFNIMNGGTRITSATYTNWNKSFAPAGSLADAPTSPGGEEPFRANDGTTSTKWLDFRGTGGGLLIDLGSNIDSTGYQWYTANDADYRDPKSWKVWASRDNQSWYLVSDVSGFSAPATRFAFAGSWNWIQ